MLIHRSVTHWCGMSQLSQHVCVGHSGTDHTPKLIQKFNSIEDRTNSRLFHLWYQSTINQTLFIKWYIHAITLTSPKADWHWQRGFGKFFLRGDHLLNFAAQAKNAFSLQMYHLKRNKQAFRNVGYLLSKSSVTTTKTHYTVNIIQYIEKENKLVHKTDLKWWTYLKLKYVCFKHIC